MNPLLWTLQTLLALHTAMGAVWKTTNPEATVPSLSAIPHAGWIGLNVVEVLCVIGLLIPAVSKSAGKAAPIAALVIAAEMLLFCGVLLASGKGSAGELAYWLVVAAVCGFIAYGRLVLKPL